jgi:hypothetical protein
MMLLTGKMDGEVKVLTGMHIKKVLLITEWKLKQRCKQCIFPKVTNITQRATGTVTEAQQKFS